MSQDDDFVVSGSYASPVHPLSRPTTFARKALYGPIHNSKGRGNTSPDFNDNYNNNNATCGDRNGRRMQDYSLAQRIYLLSKKVNGNDISGDFEVLMSIVSDEEELNNTNLPSIKQAAKAADAVVVTSPTPTMFWSILGSSGVLAVSSWLCDPVHARTLWKTVVSKNIGAALAVAWLPWVWAHPGQLALVDLLLFLQLVRHPAVLPYFQKQVLPVIWRTAKAMIVAEMWTRGWKWFFAHLDHARQYAMTQLGTSMEDTNVLDGEHKNATDILSLGLLSWPLESEPPGWLVEAHSLIVGSIRKGVKSSVKKSIQETITSSIMVWRNVLQQQVLVGAAP